MDKMEIFDCSIDEINALKFAYYNALYHMHHDKGFRYKQAFNIVKNIKKLIPETKKYNIDELLNIYDDSEVFAHENNLNT